jgi:hypothetical protein
VQFFRTELNSLDVCASACSTLVPLQAQARWLFIDTRACALDRKINLRKRMMSEINKIAAR